MSTSTKPESASRETTRAGSSVLRPAALWRSLNFCLLSGGELVSSVGSQVSQFAMPLLAYALTSSWALAGIVGALRVLPFLLLGLPAGALVDRWDRRRVMLVCDTGRALALGSVPVAFAFHRLTFAQLCVVTLLEGALFIFFNLAEAAILPDIVPAEQLATAAAIEQGTVSASLLVGPALGGSLYGIARSLPFLADAVSYAGSVLSLVAVRGDFRPERASADGEATLVREIGEGLAWLWHEPRVRYLALLYSGLLVCSSGYPLVVLALVGGMRASASATGLIFAAGGLGSLLGSLALPPLRRWLGFRPALIVATWLWALLWPIYLLPHTVWGLGVVVVIGYLPVPVLVALIYSYRLEIIPSALRGRVNSVYRMMVYGGNALGYALAGLLLQRFGPGPTVLLLFVPQLALAAYTTWYPVLRASGTPARSA